MGSDVRKELKRLEAELLAEEQAAQEEYLDDILFEDDDTTPADVQVPYRNFANGYTNQRADVDLDRYSDEVYNGAKSSNKPLVILALILFSCIMLVLCWWVWRLGGFQ